MSEPQLNLNQLTGQGLSNHKYDIRANNETPEDAEARRAQEAKDADLRRRIEFILFLAALLFVFIVFLSCMFVFWNGGSDDKKWAAGIVSAIASGLVGYLVGQGKK